MKLAAFKLLTDENIHRDVVQFLRRQGFDVQDVSEQNLFGTPDLDLVRTAFAEGRVILTHDSDFGTLAVLAGEPIMGIVYLRPGHIDPSFTIQTIETILKADQDVSPPFIIVGHRKGSFVTIRVRSL